MGANQNKKISVFGGQFEPDFTGQFGPDLGGQFNSDFGGQYDWFFQHNFITSFLKSRRRLLMILESFNNLPA